MVGIASIWLTNPVVMLCQLPDSFIYLGTLTKLLFINPAHYLCRAEVKLYKEIASYSPLATVVPLQMLRRRFYKYCLAAANG